MIEKLIIIASMITQPTIEHKIYEQKPQIEIREEIRTNTRRTYPYIKQFAIREEEINIYLKPRELKNIKIKYPPQKINTNKAQTNYNRTQHK